jgi:hypothetical protein
MAPRLFTTDDIPSRLFVNNEVGPILVNIGRKMEISYIQWGIRNRSRITPKKS